MDDRVKNILNPSMREHDLLQSYVHVEQSPDQHHHHQRQVSSKSPEETLTRRNVSHSGASRKSKEKNEGGGGGGRRRPKSKTNELDFKLRKPRRRRQRSSEAHRQEEVYTDKDRAAAVNMGSKDIKQSLSMKKRQDRNENLQLPEDAEPSTLLTLGIREMRIGDVTVALNCINKALDLSEHDKNALIARSKCYLLLGKPNEALLDAERALEGKSNDSNTAKAMYYKAEALYHLGDYEMSLVFYHRGMRIRPEFTQFRLGVQKAKEAIRNMLGG